MGSGLAHVSVAGVKRIFEAKGRSQQAPLTLAIKSAEEALDYVPHPGRIAERLARRCWPGPITLVMDRYICGQTGHEQAGHGQAGHGPHGPARREVDRRITDGLPAARLESERLTTDGVNTGSWTTGGCSSVV